MSMVKNMRNWAVVLSAVAAAGVLYLTGDIRAGGKASPLSGDTRKIAAAVKAGKKDDAEALAKKTAKKAEELGDIMHMFKNRNKGGLGVGEMPQAKSDGIESKLRDVARDAPSAAVMAKEAPGLQQLGYDTAALALLTKAMAPAKDQGKKKASDFKKWADEMYDAGVEFAKTAGEKGAGAQNVKAAATKVNETCNRCHSVFRE
jgi:hypothetical protein